MPPKGSSKAMARPGNRSAITDAGLLEALRMAEALMRRVIRQAVNRHREHARDLATLWAELGEIHDARMELERRMDAHRVWDEALAGKVA